MFYDNVTDSLLSAVPVAWRYTFMLPEKLSLRKPSGIGGIGKNNLLEARELRPARDYPKHRIAMRPA